MKPPKPVILALWRRRHPEASTDEFEAGWLAAGSSKEHLCAWLEIEGLLPVLEVARETATDQDIEPVLELAGVSVEEYQTARDDLGWEKLRFSQTEHRYATVARWIFPDGRMSLHGPASPDRLRCSQPGPLPYHTFTAAEAYSGSCTAKTTIYCANIATGMMLAQFTKYLRGLPVQPDVQLNLLSAEIAVSP